VCVPSLRLPLRVTAAVRLRLGWFGIVGGIPPHMAAVIFGKTVTVLDDNTLHRAVRCWEQVGTVWSFHRYTRMRPGPCEAERRCPRERRQTWIGLIGGKSNSKIGRQLRRKAVDKFSGEGLREETQKR
jgi:hypothetical protein